MRRTSGFTLAEVLVTIVLITALVGVIAPRVIGRVAQGEATALSGNLNAVTGAILEFRSDLGRYPLQLVHLSAPPPSTAVDACGYGIPDLQKWRGPYLDRQLPSTGLPSGTSTLQNAFSASSTTPGAYKILTITVQRVDRTVADQLEAIYDGNGSLTTGTIRWSSASGSNAPGTLWYDMPIRGC